MINKELENKINKIAWWIPNKKLRDSIRDLFYNLYEESTLRNNLLISEINHLKSIIERSYHLDFIHKTIIDNIYFEFYDFITSKTVFYVSGELNSDCYGFKNINFEKGDIVIDIGGNIGMTSIFLAKKYPFIKIYSFEPVKENYENFKKNIELNNIQDGIITLENKAVTKDGRDVVLLTNTNNTGFSRISEYYSNYNQPLDIYNKVESITLEDIFNKNKIDNCKLLKIDCEGSEYEILYNTKSDILKKINNLSGEFHVFENYSLNSINDFINYLQNYIFKLYYNIDVIN